jgi:hypothetical protein
MPELSDLRPLLSSNVAQDVANYAGELQYQGNVEDTTGGFIAFGGPTADFIQYGVVNGAFSQGPPNADANIEAAVNPLPYWYGPVVVQNGAWTSQWVESSAYPSGHALRVSLTEGVAGDEVYFQQVVPIGGSSYRSTGNAVRASFSVVDGGNVDGKVALQYLKADRTATGNATSATVNLSAITYYQGIAYGHATNGASPPSDAVYLRIRVGVALTGVNAPTTVDITDVRNDFAHMRVMLAADNPSFSPGLVYQQGSAIVLAPDGGSGDTLVVGATAVSFGGDATLGGAVTLSGIISPTISASQNDWAPTGLSTASTIFVYNDSGASVNITGIDATGVAIGQTIWLHVDAGVGGTGTVVLVHNSGSSSADNRLILPSSTNVTMQGGSGIELKYLTNPRTGNMRWNAVRV